MVLVTKRQKRGASGVCHESPELGTLITMRLSESLLEQIDERARKSGNRSRSSVIREILTRELGA